MCSSTWQGTMVVLSEVSIRRTQRHARNIVADAHGPVGRSVELIANLPTATAERDVHRWARTWTDIEPYVAELPLESLEQLGAAHERVFFALPHEMLSALYKQGAHVWEPGIIGPGGTAFIRKAPCACSGRVAARLASETATTVAWFENCCLMVL